MRFDGLLLMCILGSGFNARLSLHLSRLSELDAGSGAGVCAKGSRDSADECAAGACLSARRSTSRLSSTRRRNCGSSRRRWLCVRAMVGDCMGLQRSQHIYNVLVSWLDAALAFERVRGRIKNLLSLDLSRQAGTTGRPWFAGEASRRRVTEDTHLRHLLDEYLPKHRGVQWFEGRGWGNRPDGVDPMAMG